MQQCKALQKLATTLTDFVWSMAIFEGWRTKLLETNQKSRVSILKWRANWQFLNKESYRLWSWPRIRTTTFRKNNSMRVCLGWGNLWLRNWPKLEQIWLTQLQGWPNFNCSKKRPKERSRNSQRAMNWTKFWTWRWTLITGRLSLWPSTWNSPPWRICLTKLRFNWRRIRLYFRSSRVQLPELKKESVFWTRKAESFQPSVWVVEQNTPPLMKTTWWWALMVGTIKWIWDIMDRFQITGKFLGSHHHNWHCMRILPQWKWKDPELFQLQGQTQVWAKLI